MTSHYGLSETTDVVQERLSTYLRERGNHVDMYLHSGFAGDQRQPVLIADITLGPAYLGKLVIPYAADNTPHDEWTFTRGEDTNAHQTIADLVLDMQRTFDKKITLA